MTGYIILGGGLVLAVVGLVFVAIARSKVRIARTFPLSRAAHFERPIVLLADAFADRRLEASGPPDTPSPRARAEAAEPMTMGGEVISAIPPL
jgi:hypothetical protein